MAGEYDNVTQEVKATYPDGYMDPVMNLEAIYRSKLHKDTAGASINKEGIVTFGMKLTTFGNLAIPADGAALQPVTPTNRQVRQGTVVPEIFVSAFGIGLKAKHVLATSKGTFAEGGLQGDSMEDCAKDLAKMINRVYAGSIRGRIGIVGSIATNAITLQNPLVNLIKQNDPIDVYTALTSGSVRDSLSGRRVSSFNPDTFTLVYSGADQTPVAGDSIFFASAYGQSPVGLPEIVDNGDNAATIHGQTRATYPLLKAQVLSNNGELRPLTERLLLDICSRVRTVAGKRVTRLISNDGQGRKWCEFVAADRRYAGVTAGGRPSYGVGYRPEDLSVTAPGVQATLEIDLDIPPREIYALAWDTFRLYNAKDAGWLDGEEVMRLVPSTAGYAAGYLFYMVSIENQYCPMPGGNGKLGDLIDPICLDDAA